MEDETYILLQVLLVLVPAVLLILRLIYVLPIIHSHDSPLGQLAVLPSDSKGSTIMILLGSGGHTGEMFLMLKKIDLNEFKRIWVVSSGDETSLVKAKNYEELQSTALLSSVQYLTVKRARKVGEPLILSVFSTITSFINTTKQLVLLPTLPHVLLLNGPGTSIPLAYILFIMKYCGLCQTRIIYVESLARVKKLSLLGRLIMPISDRFIVQWQALLHEYKRAEYHGILV